MMTSNNLYFAYFVGGSNEQSVDGISTSENLLDIGPPAAIENGVVGNLWAYPIPPPSINQGQNGKDITLILKGI